MSDRILISTCIWAVLALAAPLAASEPPDGLAPAEWMAIQDQIEAEVDRDLIAGKSHFERTEFGSEHGLVRTAVLSGDYSDLAAQDNSDGPRFGHSVAIDGDWLAVGAPGTIWTSDVTGTGDHGAVFIFRRTSANWTLTQRILYSSPVHAKGRCGHAVALRLPHLVYGCPDIRTFEGHAIGATRVLKQDPSGEFSHPTTMFGHLNQSGRCGSSVALSRDYLAYGCPTAVADANAGPGGRVRVLRLNPDTGDFNLEVMTLWPPNAMANARFGDAVALHQPATPQRGVAPTQPVRLAVGAPRRSPLPHVQHSGGVHVFERSSPGGTPTWTQSQFITAPTEITAAYFGQAVALSGSQLVVGAPFDVCGPGPSGQDRCGRAYRYARTGGAWQFQEIGYPTDQPGGATDDPEPGMRFGEAVAMGFDNVIAIAAPGTNAPGLFVGGDDAVGLVELRRHWSGDFNVNEYLGVVRPGALSTLTLAEGQFGTAIDFSIGARRLAVGYPGVGSALPLGSGGARRGQVWIYQIDRIFADDFESLPRAVTSAGP